MKKIRVAINGLGRIGRAFLKLAVEREEVEIVAVNDLADINNLGYLIRHDTAYGAWNHRLTIEGNFLVVDEKTRIRFVSEPDLFKLPWRELAVDVVVESTGVFTSYEKAVPHMTAAGAKRVVISAPLKEDSPEGQHCSAILMGINDNQMSSCSVTSNASCTTNAASPLMQILHEAFGIEKAMLSTIHGYTSTQSLVDSPSKHDWRRGRAAAQNIIPSSTGAAVAVTKAITDLAGKFDGIAFRVPVITGSLADVTILFSRDVQVEELNSVLRAAAKDSRWSDVFSVSDEPLVSSDIVGTLHAAIVDLSLTRVVGGNLAKVVSWYDNEMGYTNALLLHVIKSGQTL
ncbi:MAG: glyceraldehyde 3-phosphate dehydrogenase NAD-binding domain-containing protein [bacterium]|nr:glyceraldehyde 3-phosphate dehydrogenase NAD-binding domain-containing protein [bacterium]